MRYALLLLLLAGCTQSNLAVPDLGDADLGGADLATTPPIVSQPVWIGPAGSAASATQQLNVRLGGFNTAGTVAAPSGAQFTAGYFATQSN